eukprot:356636-Chlamydomonas_euryale.AAC.1
MLPRHEDGAAFASLVQLLWLWGAVATVRRRACAWCVGFGGCCDRAPPRMCSVCRRLGGRRGCAGSAVDGPRGVRRFWSGAGWQRVRGAQWVEGGVGMVSSPTQHRLTLSRP